MEDKAKIKKCKYSHPHFKNNSIEYHCIVDGWEDDKVRICKKEECESCQKFMKSRTNRSIHPDLDMKKEV